MRSVSSSNRNDCFARTIGFPALAATSMEQARVAMCHGFGIVFKTSVSAFQPYGIYSIPEISTIGPSEQELQAKGIPYEVGRARFENNARGQITGDAEGFIKILFDPATRKLLSAHVFGEHATELVHIPMFVLTCGGTIDAFIDAVFNFPTLAESFKYAAYDGLQRLAAAGRSAGAAPAAGRERGPPAMRPWVVGISPSAPPERGKPVTVCVMDRWRRCRLLTWSYEPGAAGLLPEEVEREGFVLAIGAADSVGRDLLASLEHRGYRPAGKADRHADLVLIRTDDLWKGWGGRAAPRGREGPASRRRGEGVPGAPGLRLSSARPAGPAGAA